MSSFARRPVFQPNVEAWHSTPDSTIEEISRFHRDLPGYKPTPFTNLDAIAKEIGVRAIYVKDESSRFGLPSFKVLGASWGAFRALASKLDLPLTSTIETLRQALAHSDIKLYAATEGNHGRAVAWVGRMLQVSTEIIVPATMHLSTISLIESEGAHVTVSQGDYDQAVQEALDAANAKGGVLIQDFSFGDYQEVPQWIVQGYESMMREIDDQLQGQKADLVIAPVGVGSFAQSVVSYFRQPGSVTKVLTVEPDTAACLLKSVERGQLSSISTTHTIMAGLHCGTPSSTAWPILRDGAYGYVTVSDYEAHAASQDLQSLGISAGPCGASPLAALRRLTASDMKRLGLDHNSVVVLPNTEGLREYEQPLDVSIDDPVKLTQQLVQINSANPSMGTNPGPGETEIARYVSAWLEHRGIDAHWIESIKGRPSIVGVARGNSNGKSLMFNGHIDTVTLNGYDGDPLSGTIVDGKLYGRGSADMKCGVAAAMIALANAKQSELSGDVILAAVADEEDVSIGTEDVLRAGWRADAALVNEPTNLDVFNAHKGFVWLEVDIHGVAAHGSLAHLGVDAIAKAGHFLAALDRHAEDLQNSRPESSVGSPTIHASIIKGGEEVSSYPAICAISIERRTLPGESSASVKEELNKILVDIEKNVKDFRFSIRTTFERQPFELPRDHPLCALVDKHVSRAMGKEAKFLGGPFWTDCALLSASGIDALLWGPLGEGLHSKEEWVDTESIKLVATTLTSIVKEYCK